MYFYINFFIRKNKENLVNETNIKRDCDKPSKARKVFDQRLSFDNFTHKKTSSFATTNCHENANNNQTNAYENFTSKTF